MPELTINADDIAAALARNVSDFTAGTEVEQVGRIAEVGDGIARVYGLDKCVYASCRIRNGVFGMALNLEPDNVGVVIFGEDTAIKEGETVRSSGQDHGSAGRQGNIGRIINPLGQPLDGKGPVKASRHRLLEDRAMGVVDRQPVKEPF